jgi:sporulation protein YlmC with PRC-barrel domain
MQKMLTRYSAFAALIIMPVLLAQTKMPSYTTPMSGTFLSVQASNQWLASKLVGLAVFGPANEKIGSISDLVIDQSGSVQAAVIGVGGFLGIGAKDVAIALRELTISRTSEGDKVTVRLSRNELELAPTFQVYTGEGVKPLSPAPPKRDM